MRLEIEIFHNEGDRFWLKMGRFFAHRSYAQEMGGWQFYTKPGSIWFVLFLGDDEVVGFCSAINEGRYWHFDNFYVPKEHRGNGYASLLHKARNEEIKPIGLKIKVISDNPIQIKKYEEHGFVFTGKRGRYDKYEWHPDKNAENSPNGMACSEQVEPQ